MSDRIIALHGFLGQGQDWDAVRAATKTPLEWLCPDLFAPDGPEWSPPDFVGKSWLAGYSFGARLALRWLTERPELWHGALLLSVNPGNFFTVEERSARRASDRAWARAMREESWSELMARWNAQKVFADECAPERVEKDFDRHKLALALEKFSVADQFTDPLRLPPQLNWVAGALDRKFTGLNNVMRNSGFPGTFETVEGVGHRLLQKAPAAVAAAIDNLVA